MCIKTQFKQKQQIEFWVVWSAPFKERNSKPNFLCIILCYIFYQEHRQKELMVKGSREMDMELMK